MPAPGNGHHLQTGASFGQGFVQPQDAVGETMLFPGRTVPSMAARSCKAGGCKATSPSLGGGRGALTSPPRAGYFGNRLGLAAGAGVGDS